MSKNTTVIGCLRSKFFWISNTVLLNLANPHFSFLYLHNLFLRYEAEVQRAAAELTKLPYQDGAFEEKEEIYTNLKHEVNAMRQQVNYFWGA